MPRQIRIEYLGAIYHLMSRGDRREAIVLGDRRYVRRNKKGQFKTEVDVGRSLAADRRSKATTKVAKRQGDRGDVKRYGRFSVPSPGQAPL